MGAIRVSTSFFASLTWRPWWQQRSLWGCSSVGGPAHWIHQTIVAVAIFQEALKQVSLTGKTPSEANRLLQAGFWVGGRWRAYEENLGFDDSEMHHYVP